MGFSLGMMGIATRLTDISNKPPMMVFYSGNGISIHDTDGKLRAGAKRGSVRGRKIVRRKRACVSTRTSSLRGALATKQSSLWRHWIASLRSQ
jgi:hypothetical protein